ncbi:BrnA antitoxin family protein [Candidatus Electronema sp. TJ]|uniref:BrnA antitoxin family protein n=1 Tax=Candidatus Electronema sp. TJ TaxID=3401573 RepID=UPI003AA8C748
MKENAAGLKSNFPKSDSHEISQAEYDEIPELPAEFFAEGKLYRNGRPVKRSAQRGHKKPQLAVRINREIVEFFKAHGEGWQAELNAVLQRHVDSKHAV